MFKNAVELAIQFPFFDVDPQFAKFPYAQIGVTEIARIDTTGSLSRLRAFGAMFVAGVSRLVLPDALYAAPYRGDAGCWIEGATAVAAAGGVIAAGVAVGAAEAAVGAADVAMAAALATCPVDPAGCLLGIAVATAAETAAAAAVSAANSTLTAAIATSATADAALWSCLHASSDSYTGTDYEGGGGPGGGGESCDVTIWYDDSGEISEIDGNLEDCLMT